MTESLCFCLKMLVTPQGFLGSLPIVNVDVYPDPVQQRPIACPERFEATEEPAVFPFRVSYSEGRLACSPRSVAGCPDPERLFMIIGMDELDVGVPGYIDLHPEPKRIIVSETKVIRVSSLTNVRTPDGSAYHVYAGIVLNAFRNCAANDGRCPEGQFIFDPSMRSGSCFGGIAMRASPIKPYVRAFRRRTVYAVDRILKRPRLIVTERRLWKRPMAVRRVVAPALSRGANDRY